MLLSTGAGLIKRYSRRKLDWEQVRLRNRDASPWDNYFVWPGGIVSLYSGEEMSSSWAATEEDLLICGYVFEGYVEDAVL